jgi:uncharacterized protein
MTAQFPPRTRTTGMGVKKMAAPNEGVRPCALVTGASSGIGQAFAERFAADGYDLVVVARRRERLEELATKLRATHEANVDILVADLTNATDLRQVEQRVAGDDALQMLVNNAGFGAYGPFVQLDPGRAEEQIKLHIVAPTRLTRAALPGMIARKQGTIINVSSILAFSGSLPSPPLPARATYAATKAFLNTFTELLHSELAGTGVRVQVLCPATVRTEFHRIQGIDPDRSPVVPMSAEEVVQAALAALKAGELICLPGVEDSKVIAEYQQAQTRVAQSGMPNKLASRYR